MVRAVAINLTGAQFCNPYFHYWMGIFKVYCQVYNIVMKMCILIMLKCWLKKDMKWWHFLKKKFLLLIFLILYWKCYLSISPHVCFLLVIRSLDRSVAISWKGRRLFQWSYRNTSRFFHISENLPLYQWNFVKAYFRITLINMWKLFYYLIKQQYLLFVGPTFTIYL